MEICWSELHRCFIPKSSHWSSVMGGNSNWWWVWADGIGTKGEVGRSGEHIAVQVPLINQEWRYIRTYIRNSIGLVSKHHQPLVAHLTHVRNSQDSNSSPPWQHHNNLQNKTKTSTDPYGRFLFLFPCPGTNFTRGKIEWRHLGVYNK